ncbi:MAG: molybdenum cofactor guanylyltransferase [Pyrinomonadaceae bacterium]
MALIEGFILVGGESRRMGTDKSRLVLNGQNFVDRIAGELFPLTHSVTVVGNNSEGIQSALTRQVAIAPDIYPHWGSLGGLHAALSACSAEWALAVACDFPFVTTALFSRLAHSCEGYDAVAPIQRDLVPQPLCALYRVAACRNLAEDLIKCSERKPIALLQSVRTCWVSFDELADLEGAAHFFDNINTPQDYDRAKNKSEDRPS